MKRIAIADIHLSEYKDDKLVDDLPRRLYDIFTTLTNIAKYAKENNIKNIDILGDIYNDKNIIYTDCQNLFKEFLLKHQDINFTIISGNHDLSSEGENQTSTIEALENIENVKCVIKEPYVEENMLFLPYSNKFIEYLKDYTEGYDILLSHFGVSEAVLQSGISIRSKINMKDLRIFKLILLGHYHKPQEIIDKTHSLYYIGSLIHHNWNDKNEQKRFIVYDTETYQIESIPITWITEYKELILDDIDKQNEIFEKAEKYKEQNKIVRIRKKINDELDKKLLKEDLIIVDDTEEDIVSNRGINIEQSHEDKFKKYLEFKNIQSDKDDYMDIVLKIINKQQIFKDFEKVNIEDKEIQNIEENKEQFELELDLADI